MFRYNFILFIFITSLVSAELLTPANEAELNYIHVLFEWEQEPDASTYLIEISTDSDFSNPETSQNVSSLIYIEKEIIDWENTYYWRVCPVFNDGSYGAWIGTRMFSTGATISNAETIVYNEILYSEGLTIFGAFYDYYSAIIDKTGKEIWNSENHPFIFYNTDYYGKFYGCEYVAGQSNGNFYKGIEFSLDNEIVWEEPNDEFNHHEIIQLPNENYLGIVEVEHPGSVPIGDWTATCNTFYPGLCDGIIPFFTWFGDKLVEWDKDTKEVLWEWNFFDHLSMDDYDIENGTWFDAFIATPQRYDWTHANALWFDETESAIFVSIRHLSRIVKISYPSGDILWSMGENMSSGDVDFGHELGFNFQHSLQVLENGNILIFDNGNLTSQSRALEIEISENSGVYSSDIVFEHILTSGLYGAFSGNVQKTKNDNYLITTIGESGTTQEISPAQDKLWETKYHLSEPLGAVYRANRIPGLYPIAFSLIVPHFIVDNSSDINPLNIDENSMSFILYNDGEIAETYNISFIDYSKWFTDDYISLNLESGESKNFSFNYLGEGENEYFNFELTITPDNRNDLSKQICYPNLLVYPGDTDNNGFVDLNDILPVGIYYNSIGDSRTTQSVLWESKNMCPWDVLPATYADANGDGIVNGKDVIGIGVNWGKSHEISGKMHTLEMTKELILNDKYIENFKLLYQSLKGDGELISTIRSELEKILYLESPEKISILQNYPNPFNSKTTIHFSIPYQGKVFISLYDLGGRKITEIIDDIFYPAGEHAVELDIGHLSSGVYLYTLGTESKTTNQKMILIK